MKRAVAREIYEFGGFHLNPGRRRLATREGNVVELSAKAFDALVLLVERAGEPVSRKALIDALWPDTVVEENNLTQAISVLRRALGSGYIVTLAGRGYQFVAVVRTGTSDGDAAAPAAQAAEVQGGRGMIATPATAAPAAPPAPVSKQRSRRGAAVAAAAALALLLVGWIVLSPPATEEVPEQAAAEAPVTVAVLPFASSSPAPEHRAFADGLTDELITALGQLPGLRVQGRTTSFALRASGRSVPEIAAELGVRYVIEGSVGRDRDRLRVRAQISDAAGFSVWADSYDRPLASIFDIQDEIVTAVAERLRATLGLDQALRRASTDNVEAYILYLVARAEANRGFASGGYQRSLALLKRALQFDPDFSMAWTLQSIQRSILAPLSADAQAELDGAEEDAMRAIALAPDRGYGYSARALVRGIRGDWRGAEQDWERAIELGHTDIPPYTTLLFSVGRFEKGRDTIEQMVESDRLNADSLAFLMESHELLRDSEAADAVYRRGRELYQPWFGEGLANWIHLGRRDVLAITETGWQDARFAPFVEILDDPDGVLALVRELAANPAYQAPAPLQVLAMWAAYAGDPQLSLRLLEQAVSGSALLMTHTWLPIFDEVRQLPEFGDLLVDIGLVDYWQSTGWPAVCRPVGAGDVACD